MDTVKLTKMDDYEAEGKVDWSAYRKAQTENGEICRKCRSYITFAKGRTIACRDCQKLENDDGEVWSDNYVRCPKCGTTWQPYESEQYELLGDGTHDVCCQNCDHDFEVSTSISWNFNSPPRIQEDDSGDENGQALGDPNEESTDRNSKAPATGEAERDKAHS